MRQLSAIILFLFIACGQAAGKIVHSETSLYQNIIVSEAQGKRCLKFSKRRRVSNQSCQFVNKPNDLVFVYSKLMMGSLFINQQPNNILVIGLGAGTIPTTFAQLFPKAMIESVEIDPVVVNIAKKYFSFKENDRNRIHTIDARVFVKRAIKKKRQYDLIVLDAFNGDYIPEHLMTLEFFQEVKNIMPPNGVLAANTFTTSKLARYETETYLAVFGSLLQLKSSISNNRVIIASKDKKYFDSEHIAKGEINISNALKKFDVDSKWILKTMAELSREADTKFLLTDQFSPINILNSQKN